MSNNYKKKKKDIFITIIFFSDQYWFTEQASGVHFIGQCEFKKDKIVATLDQNWLHWS